MSIEFSELKAKAKKFCCNIIQFDEAKKPKEDNLKQIKKLTNILKEITRECEELRTSKDELFSSSNVTTA